MFTVLIALLSLVFLAGGISPLLVTDDTSEIIAGKEERTQPSSHACER